MRRTSGSRTRLAKTWSWRSFGSVARRRSRSRTRRVGADRVPDETGREREPGIQEHHGAPVAVHQRHEHAVRRRQRNDQAERGPGRVDAHGKPPLFACEPERHELGSADRHERSAQSEYRDREKQSEIAFGETAQGAGGRDDQHREHERAAGPHPVGQCAARRCGRDVHERPGAEHGAHGRMADRKITRDRLHQRGKRSDCHAEAGIREPDARQHDPSIGVGRIDDIGQCCFAFDLQRGARLVMAGAAAAANVEPCSAHRGRAGRRARFRTGRRKLASIRVNGERRWLFGMTF